MHNNNNNRKPFQQRPNFTGGAKGFQQPHNPYYQEAGTPVYSYSTVPKRTDVGYTGGGGGPRLSITVPQYSVASGHPSTPNSASQQVQQQQQQNSQIRAQAPPTLPSTHPHNSSGSGSQGSQPSQHIPHPHSALAQHHHQVLTSGNVTGATGIGNPVQQSGVSLPAGQSPAPQAPQHDLNAQGIQTSTHIANNGVALSNTVTPTIMYPNPANNHNQIPQTAQSNPQARNLIATHQFYNPAQQNAAHLHPGNQHHRQVLTQQPNMQGFPYANIIPSNVLQANQHYFSQLATMPQHRQGASSNQHQFAATQMMTPAPNHYPIPYQVQAPIYYAQPQNKPPPNPTPPAPRERKIIPIVDPNTNKNILEEMSLSSKVNDNATTPVQSRDSSTANTPAPGDTAQKNEAVLMANEFALAVMNRMSMDGDTNEQQEAVERIIPNKTIESSHIEKSDNENRISSVDNKNETVNKINQSKVVPVPEHSVKTSKTEQPVIQSTQSLNSPISQNESNSGLSSQTQGSLQQPPPPPQPQRPAKQPRGGQHQNSQKGSSGCQQQASNKQPSPQQSSKSTPKNSGNHASQKGIQQAAQVQQQQPKRGASPNAQNSKNNNQNVSKNIPQSHQIKLASDNIQSAKVQPSHAHLGSNQVPPQQNICQSPKDQVVSHHQPSSTSQQQRMTMQGQNIRGSSPPNEAVSQGAPQKLSGEIPMQASAAPIKQSEKLPSPNLEQIPIANNETSKEASSNKHAVSKNAAGSISTSSAVSKKEREVESTQTAVGKRGGKDKNANEVQQPKENKELPSKISVEEVPTKLEGSSSSQKKEQLPHSKHKPQSTNNSSKDAPITNPPQASQQQPQQKPESPIQVQDAKIISIVAASQTPETLTTSDEFGITCDTLPPKTVLVEAELNHVDEVKINNHEENHVSDKPKSSSLKYNYKEGQWSPENQDGKRQYDRAFLLEMSKNPLSNKRPDSLPNLEVVLDHAAHRSLPLDGKSRATLDFIPGYLQNPNKHKGKYGTRNSLQGQKKGGSMGGNMGMGGMCDGPRVISVNLNITERQLTTSENAWKVSNRKELNEDEVIVRKMRGILNKLTPDNFERLTEQITKFKIVDFSTFDKVIGLIFEKAVDEQAFSKTYADLCKVLSQLSVKGKTDKEKEGSSGEARFRNLLINKCQQEFEKDNNKDIEKEEKLKRISETKSTDYKAELKAQLEVHETKLRLRSVGNIRFIGELYKNRMLTSSIMMRIICGLLSKRDEESLECLCKLVSTIGYMLEPQSQASAKAQADLNEVFNTLQKIVHERKVSSRVRFMLMDLMDQRKNQWVRRREDAKPKKKAEVHEEIRKEELEQQYLLSTAPKRDDRERKRSRDNRGGMMTDDSGWNTVLSSRRGPFDSSRLKNTTFSRSDNEPEFRAKFSSWATGSTGGSKNHDEEPSRPSVNRFAVLEKQLPMEIGRSNPMQPRLAPGGMNVHRQGTNSFGSKSMPPPLEKDTIHYSKMSSTSGDRSKSNSRSNSRQSSRDNSMAREAPTSTRDMQKVTQSKPMDMETMQKYANVILEEYYSCNDVKEASTCFNEKFKQKADILKFIEHSFECVIDKPAEKRGRAGNLYHYLIKENFLSVSQFGEGCQPILNLLSDFVIDIPQVNSYVGGILCRLLVDNVVKLENILKILDSCEREKMDVFAKVIKEASKIMKESQLIELWKSSNICLEALLPKNTTVNEYLNKHEIQFLREINSSKGSVAAGEDLPIDAKIVRMELSKLFKSDTPEEEIFDWIEKNIGSKTNTKLFIRALTTALIESLLTRTDVNSYVTIDEFNGKLKEKGKFIHKYVDSNQDLELACIYAMQALSVECQHPPGLLEKAFNVLYDMEILIEDSFFRWEKTDDPEGHVGKGVCLTSVKKFLDWLKVVEDPAESGMDEN